jgi:ubiquinone/menaquinone biosynthesis C-methylase UbiE
MGSQLIQGKLWGQRSKDWAAIQEPTASAEYVYVLNKLELKTTDRLLDVGCGTGLFSSMAAERGASVTAVDASGPMIAEAIERTSRVAFMAGEMEELPFADGEFDIVCGFNSFQYAASTTNALAEAWRVLKNEGIIVTMIWGNKEDCEAATYLKAVGSLLPPSPPGAGGPFALSENQLLEKTLEKVGFKIISNEDVTGMWDYADSNTALRGLLSAGPAAKAIEHTGFQKVHDTVLEALQPYIQNNGHVVYRNKFRIIFAQK